MRVPYNQLSIKERIRFDLERRVVSHMTQTSWKTVPHVAVLYEPDITDLFDEFTALQKQLLTERGLKCTFNALMLKVISEALKCSPELNAYINYRAFTKTGTCTIFEQF